MSSRWILFYALEIAGVTILLAHLLGGIAWWVGLILLVVGWIGRMTS